VPLAVLFSEPQFSPAGICANSGEFVTDFAESLYDGQRMTMQHSSKEKAFLYDLFIVPGWREHFDSLLDETFNPPQKIKVLDAGCGTGGYAVALAGKLGPDSQVTGVEVSEEMLEIARGKAEMQKMKHLRFEQGAPENTGQSENHFDLVIGDVTFDKPDRYEAVFRELVRVAAPKGTVAVKVASHGSFDEFFSIYWEALHEAGLDDLTASLESLITERWTTGKLEGLAKKNGLHRVQSVTRKVRFDYADAQTFFNAPLIEHYFLQEWLAIIPVEKDRQQVRQQLANIIERERQGCDWDVSIKTTLVTGQK
jgi:ubiquinone/menaquinone biosynthesis C-methylase UbiE